MDEMVQKMFASIEEKYGKPVSYWVQLIQSSGLEKHGERVNLLKKEHGFAHGFANLVAHEAKNPVSEQTKSSTDELLVEQYKGKEDLKEVYDQLISEVEKFGNDVEVAIKKSYVSLRRDVQFGIIQPSTKTRIDVGLVIKNEEVPYEKAGSFNSMCSHRIRMTPEVPVKDVVKALNTAYNEAKR